MPHTLLRVPQQLVLMVLIGAGACLADSTEDLLKAISKGNAKDVAKLLARGVDPAALDKKTGRMPLEVAREAKDSDVRRLVELQHFQNAQKANAGAPQNLIYFNLAPARFKEALLEVLASRKLKSLSDGDSFITASFLPLTVVEAKPKAMQNSFMRVGGGQMIHVPGTGPIIALDLGKYAFLNVVYRASWDKRTLRIKKLQPNRDATDYEETEVEKDLVEEIRNRVVVQPQ